MTQVNYIQGIDVSKWQGDVNYDLVISAGFRFAIVKCSEGTGSYDEYFKRNWDKLMFRDERIYRGAYHFARPDTQGGDQADAMREAMSFCKKLKEVGGYGLNCLPPVIDFEKYSDNGAAETEVYLKEFVRVVEGELGRSPMIYTGANVWKYEGGNRSYLSHLPLWQVAYTTAPAPQKLIGWDKWTIWQWSAGGSFNYYGKVSGVNGDCDVNRYWGDENSLRALATPKIWTPSSAWNPDSEAHTNQPPKPTPPPAGELGQKQFDADMDALKEMTRELESALNELQVKWRGFIK